MSSSFTVLSASEVRGQSISITNPPEAQVLDLTQRQRERNGDVEPVDFILRWSVSGSSGYEMRLTYCRTDFGDIAQDLVAVDTGASNTDEPSPSDRTYQVTISEDRLLARINGNVACQTSDDPFPREGNLSLYVLLFEPNETENDFPDARREKFTFTYDLEGPQPPTLTGVDNGRRSVELNWEQSSDSRVAFYEVQYCSIVPESFDVIPQDRKTLTSELVDPLYDDRGAYSITYQDGDWVCSNPAINPGGIQAQRDIGIRAESIRLDDEIGDDDWVIFRMLAVDQAPFRNRTSPEDAKIYAVSTLALRDFVDVQATQGDDFEDGGFCFVATAAHGSYAHPVVMVLRAFRDHVLARIPFGRTFIRLYYHYSPPLADALRSHPSLARWARAVLLSIVVSMGVLFVVLLGVFVRLGWRGVRRNMTAGAAHGLIVGAVLTAGSPDTAMAQYRGDPSGPLGWSFEFKAGSYLPALAEQDDGAAGRTPWSQVYGVNDTVALLNLGLELQLFRGDAGTLSVLGTVGFAKWNGRAVLLSGDEPRAGPKGSSTFNVVPMTFSAGYRFDYLMDHKRIPLAPYVRGGLIYNIWWNTRDDGSLSEGRTEEDGRYLGYGGKIGFVGTAGLAFQLNFISPRSAEQLREWTRVRATYLFFEGQLSAFEDGGIDFSELTWFAGLSLEI